MGAMFKSTAAALAFAGVVCAQSSSIISVFLPDTDQQTLVGSLVASDASKTTIAFGCPSGEDSSDCGFGSGLVTATFGSSTLAYTQTLDSLTLGLDCAVTGTTAATCTQTYVGPAGYLEEMTATDLTATDTSFNTQVTTSVTSTALAQTDVTFMPITLTAFANAASTGTGATSTSSGTHTTATSTGSGTAATATHTGAATAMGSLHGKWALAGTAGLVGLAAMVL
ncbi:hypothetical protein H2200_003130 [Cladophialophora chaetospira]|uniref:GPI anchored protein n=1 Tax=Cladophialophora chaetospira TaxID=386627 RepID=A0AA39CL63_9EURO|nr:hypothetical protein H2200_003130 [Cladophialophora chaetospira]